LISGGKVIDHVRSGVLHVCSCLGAVAM